MARISLMEKMAKETNNFTDPDYVKAYNEAMEEYEKEIREYHQSKEYQNLKAKRERQQQKAELKAQSKHKTKAYG